MTMSNQEHNPEKYFEQLRNGEVEGIDIHRTSIEFTPSENDSFEESFQLPKDAERILKMEIQSDIPEQLYKRGSIKARLDGMELLSDRPVRCQFLLSTPHNAVSQRGIWLNNHPMMLAQRNLEIKYVDNANPQTQFQAHKVYVLLTYARKKN